MASFSTCLTMQFTGLSKKINTEIELRITSRSYGVFPNNDSIRKILYLAIKNISKRWAMPIRNWKQALNQFVILLGEDRVSLSA